MTDRTPPKLIKLYQEMADFTLPECKQCIRPYSCCSPEYCDFTMDFAARRGVKLEPTGHERLPLMGKSGCIAPPHLRPMCTVHTCDIHSMGYKKNDFPAGSWTEKYYDLRSKIEEAELEFDMVTNWAPDTTK